MTRNNRPLQEILERIDGLFQQGKFMEALPLSEDVLKKFPNFPISYITIAICHSELGKADLALDILRKAEILFPHENNVPMSLGFIEKEKKHYNQAIHYFQKAFS